MHERDHQFPRNVIGYSALKYLQRKLTDRAARLPMGFDAREDWEKYRAGLVRALHDLLPVWELEDPGRVVSPDLRNAPLEASSFWTLGQARGELPTSSTSHFPVGVWAPMLVSLRHSCV